MVKDPFVHPYIPNSVPKVLDEMIKEIGIASLDELFSEIPEELRFKGSLNIPDPFLSEMELTRHVDELLSKNQSTQEMISFLGAGCYKHYVPAICDEIAGRAEFLTGYAGEPYEDHGRFQALFEYQSMMAELLDMDVVNVPTYDWCQAAATSMRMAGRITGRTKVLVARTANPQRFSAIKNYCRPSMSVETVDYCRESGWIDLTDLQAKLSQNVAAVYLENPNYLGLIEAKGNEIADAVHSSGALFVVGVDPISLGLISPPSHYGADIVCGDIQTLGTRMSYGGGAAGFIATKDTVEYVSEFPSRLFGIAKTVIEGEWGFGDVYYDRTSFAKRELGKEFVGTASALTGITAAVYLALMGPLGMQEIGKTIMQNAAYAAKQISFIPGLKANRFGTPFFREFLVDFSSTGLTAEEVNEGLRNHNILGAVDVSSQFPELGQSSLFCVTEMHSKKDILALCDALSSISVAKGGKE